MCFNRNTSGAFLLSCRSSVQIGTYASFVCGSLVVLVIAILWLSGYTCVAINGKESDRMTETKNLCAQIPLELHAQVCEEREKLNMTTSQYITNLLRTYYTVYRVQQHGGKTMENNRTMAFQIPEELFQRIKAHLERETARTGRKLTQREFVLGLIEEALNEAERQAGVVHCEDAAPQDGTQPLEDTDTAVSGEEEAE